MDKVLQVVRNCGFFRPCIRVASAVPECHGGCVGYIPSLKIEYDSDNGVEHHKVTSDTIIAIGKKCDIFNM